MKCFLNVSQGQINPNLVFDIIFELPLSLDYYAVITYISEYLCKGDTGLMKKLLDMISRNRDRGGSLQDVSCFMLVNKNFSPLNILKLR